MMFCDRTPPGPYWTVYVGDFKIGPRPVSRIALLVIIDRGCGYLFSLGRIAYLKTYRDRRYGLQGQKVNEEETGEKGRRQGRSTHDSLQLYMPISRGMIGWPVGCIFWPSRFWS